ncbi:hypothetical protein VFPFJ_10621 [Purpureocillium lilacinum]|uniref:Uncharacterized protein n=1 Tax=Purpureocillium lilacinum TaxID=33203 RepID=A0A179GDE9_PURLI|nr:hypothetical protein VFPFJ_10621 [Purpureocillium lilacinum]OAQ75857.1 hypothetical protein VFPFJ_10621 [Purpureocillium lilacinum]
MHQKRRFSLFLQSICSAWLHNIEETRAFEKRARWTFIFVLSVWSFARQLEVEISSRAHVRLPETCSV